MPKKEESKRKSANKVKVLKKRVDEKEKFVKEPQPDKNLLDLEDEGIYKAVFESAYDSILLIDKQGRIIDFNKRLIDFSGYQKEDFLGKNIMSLSRMMTRKSLSLGTDNFLKRLAGSHVSPYEMDLIKKNGELVTAEVGAQPLLKNGKIIGDLVMLRNITERKRTENELIKRSSEIETINSINDAANRGLTLKEIIQLVSEEIQKLYGGFAATTYLFCDDKQCLAVQNIGLPTKIVRNIEKLIGMKIPPVKFKLKTGSIYREILKSSKMQVFNDPLIIQKMAEECTEYKAIKKVVPAILQLLGIRSVLCVPLVSDGEAIGLLSTSRHEPFLDTDLEHIQSIAGQFVNVIKRKQAEETLSEREERYRLILDNSLDIIFTLDSEGKFVYISPSIKKVLGYNQTALIGQTFQSAVHPDDVATVIGSIERLFKEGYNTPGGIEFRVRHNSGEWRWLNATGNNAYDEDSKFLYFVGVVRDITERKLVEEALKESEMKYRNVVELAKDGICIIQNKLIKYCNPQLVELWGGTIEEIKDTPFSNYLHPDSFALIVERYNQRMAGEQIPSRYETTLRDKNGNKVNVEVNVGIINYLGQNAEIAIIHDITERKHVEEAMQESEEKYRLIVENSHDIIFTLNSDGKFIYTSPSIKKVLGYNQTDLIGQTFRSLLHPDDMATIKKLAHRMFKDGNYSTELIEFRTRHSSGKWLWCDVNGNSAFDLNGNFLNFVGVLRDITERKQTEAALKASEQNFHNSLDNSFLGIYIIDKTGTILYANRAFLDMFGYQDIDEARTSPPHEHYTVEEYTRFVRRREEGLRGEPIQLKGEVDIVRKDGTVRHLQVLRREILWDGKQQLQVIYSDITERKQAEEALKISEQNFRNSLDRSLMGIRIGDETEQIYYVNQAFLDIFGYENIEEVKASPPSAHYTPESAADLVLRREKLSRQESIPDQIEVDIIRKDGAVRHLQIFYKEVFWDNKQQHQLLYNDITERKQIEDALKASEQNFHNSMDAFLIGARITSLDNRTLYANQAFLDIFGYENIEEARKSPPHERYTPESYAEYLRRKERSARGESLPDTIDTDIVRKDGAVRHLHVFAKKIFWNGEEHYQGLYQDITEYIKAEESLKASEQNFRNSMDSSFMGINIIDSDFKTLYANQALLDIFGYKNIDEVKINPPYKYYTPESYLDYVRRNERILHGEPVPEKIEVDIIREDGITRHIQVFRREVFWNGKQQYQTFYNDITEQKKIEIALQESEEKYRTVFESANDIIILLDTAGKILDVNARIKDVGGYDSDELIGKNIGELTNIISKENLSIVVGNLQTILIGTGVLTYQIEMIKKNREPIYLEINALPIKKDDKVVGVLAILRDITERNKSELQIREQKALTDRILASTTSAVAVVGQDRRLIMVNKSFENQFKPAEGKEIGEIIPVSRFIDTISQVLDSDKSQFHFEFRFRRGAQERNLVADIITMQKNEALVILHDVTEEREMQERFYLTDRLASVGEMAAGIAHELNNPLTGVVALSQLLLESGVPDEIKEDLEAISSEGQRAANVIRNLLAFARNHTLSAELIEINEIISQVLSLRAYEHRVNNIIVTTCLSSNLPKIVADRFQMQQVFLNIVLNAEQAMTESKGRGSLIVTTEPLDGIIRIIFANDGPGIPPEIMNRIFDPFFTTKEVGKGTGLGLSICYGIIASQSGRIYVDSKPGSGATFIIELPISTH